jgi:hypothetical protein
MPHATTPASRRPIEKRRPATEAGSGPRAADDESSVAEQHSGHAWLWPWVLASIGFLLTLALLR